MVCITAGPVSGVMNRKRMCKVCDFRWRFRPLPRVMDITVKMIIKGEATGGPTSSTRRERREESG